ncbi:MAG: hypothetical protein R2848_15330 [Thermomicrobiales bacterium]
MSSKSSTRVKTVLSVTPVMSARFWVMRFLLAEASRALGWEPTSLAKMAETKRSMAANEAAGESWSAA